MSAAPVDTPAVQEDNPTTSTPNQEQEETGRRRDRRRDRRPGRGPGRDRNCQARNQQKTHNSYKSMGARKTRTRSTQTKK